MADQSLNFKGLYDSNINLNDAKNNNGYKPTMKDSMSMFAQQANAKLNQFGSTETMSFYNPLYQNQYKPRYEASWQYNNLGFDPHRDNEALYNEKMGAVDKFQRAAKQTGKVMLYAGIDQATFGATSLLTADKFAEANAIGGSSEKGLYSSVLNLMINSGFTLGIAGECLLENVAIGAATLGVGNMLTAAKTGKSLATIKRGLSMAEAARKQRTITAELESMTKASKLTDFAKQAANFINPLENTTSFIKSMGDAERLGKAMQSGEKIAKGTTALWRDVQAARGVYTESKLEGNFAMKDMQDKWIMDYQQMYGKPPSEEEAKAFKENSLAANYATSMINLPLIYFTNKITLAPIFRPLEKSFSGQVFGQGAKKVYLDISDSGLRTIKKLPKETLNRIGFLAKNQPKTLIKNSIKYSGENFMEGAQEVLQEITSGTAKEYYLDNYDAKLRGSWYDYLKSNAASQVSKQGLDTFASGMLMQAFLSPIYRMTGGIMRGAKGSRDTFAGRMVDRFDDFRHRGDEEYKTNKEKMRQDEEQRLDEEMDEINYFFQNAANYFNGNYEEMAKSKRFNDLFKGRSYDELNDSERKVYAEAVHQRLNQYVVNAIQRGYFPAVIEQMKDMSKTLKNSREDVVNDIGAEQAEYLEKNVDAFIEKAEGIKNDYDMISNTFKLPFSQEDMSRVLNSSKNPQAERKAMELANEAYNKAMADYIFAKDSLKLGLKKQEKINSEAMSLFNESRSSIPWDSISMLYDTKSIYDRLQTIQGMLNGFGGEEGLLSTKEEDRPEAMKKQIEQLELEQLNLTNILNAIADKKSLTKTDKAGNVKDKTDAEIKKDKESVKRHMRSYLVHMDQVHNPDASVRKYATYDKLADLIMDYNEVSEINNINNQTIEYLTDPDIWQRNIDVIAKAAESVYDKHQDEIKDSIEQAEVDKNNDELVHDLYINGIVCDKDDIRKARTEKKMPESLIDRESNAKIKYTDEKYGVAVDIFKKHIKGLTDIPIPQKGTKGLKYGDSKTVEEYSDDGINTGTTHSAKELLDKFIAGGKLPGEGNYAARRRLAEAMSKVPGISSIEIKFVDDMDVPLKIEGNKLTMDIKFFAKDYKDHVDYSFCLLKGITGALTSDELRNDESDFHKEMLKLYEEAKKQYEEEKEKFDLMPFEKAGFDSLQEFTMEALTNESFQAMLAGMKSTNPKSKAERNIFSTFVSYVKKFMQDLLNIPKTSNLLDDTLEVITDYLSKGVEDINEQDIDEGPTMPIDVFSDSDTLLVSLTPTEKDIIANTYLVMHNEERKGRSNDDIISSDKFMSWWNDGENFTVLSFIESHKASIAQRDRKMKLGSVNLLANFPTKMENYEYNRTGNPTRARLAIIAQKMLEGHIDIADVDKNTPIESEPDLFSQMEMDIWNAEDEYGKHIFRKEIRTIINDIIDSTENVNKNNVIDHIEKLADLGYDSKELAKLGIKRVASLSAMAIPYDELKNVVNADLASKNLGSLSDVILSDTLKSIKSVDELDAWKDTQLKILSQIATTSMPSNLSVYEVEKAYQEKLKELEGESPEVEEKATEEAETEQTEEQQEEDTATKVNDVILYKDKPYLVTEISDDSFVLQDPNGNEITISFIDEYEHVSRPINQVEIKEQYFNLHNDAIDGTTSSTEIQNDVAENVSEEKEDSTSEYQDKLLSLSKNIIENFKKCK